MIIGRQDFIATARSWIGVEYHHQGASRYGCDCIGLVIGILAELGIDYSSFDIPDRTERPNGNQMQSQIELVCGGGQQRHPMVGDLALFKIYNEPQHCGIISDLGYSLGLIHADRSIGKVVECALSPMWESRLIAVYQIPVLNYAASVSVEIETGDSL